MAMFHGNSTNRTLEQFQEDQNTEIQFVHYWKKLSIFAMEIFVISPQSVPLRVRNLSLSVRNEYEVCFADPFEPRTWLYFKTRNQLDSSTRKQSDSSTRKQRDSLCVRNDTQLHAERMVGQ